MDSNDVQADLKHVLYTKEQIQQRITELAAQIDKDYEGREILIVGVLKGAVMVMADLARALHSHISMDWMAVSSYGSGTQSSGVVRILKDLSSDLDGRHVIVVDDVLDHEHVPAADVVADLQPEVAQAGVGGDLHAAEQAGGPADERRREVRRP